MKKLLILAVGFMFVGCAYIMHKDSQDVSVKSTPTNAKVVITTIGGVPVFEGTTPASAKLKKKNKYIVTVSMQGYADKTIQIDQTLDPMVIGNLLCGGIPGMIVDGMSGAMWLLEPDQIIVTLEMASLNDGPEKFYAVVSWLNENNQTVKFPLELEKNN